jgi:aspartate dehydrogenase
MKLALIGFGGIGQIVADHLAQDAGLQFIAVVARPHQHGAVRSRLGEVACVSTPEALIAQAPDLVIECASHDAFRAYAPPVLAAGLDLVAVSVGVLAEAALRREVFEAARQSGASLQIPAGAIGAIDAIAAARFSGLEEVAYVTRKNAATWAGTPAESLIDLTRVREPTLFFDATAEQAALLFKEKANVTATLALAGLGFEHTRVRFWVDPAATRSMHHIEVRGACGTLQLDMANTVASPTCKASLQTAMSIVQSVRNRTATLRF